MLGCLLKARGLRLESCLRSPLWPSWELSCRKTAGEWVSGPVPYASHAAPLPALHLPGEGGGARPAAVEGAASRVPRASLSQSGDGARVMGASVEGRACWPYTERFWARAKGRRGPH